MKFFLYVLMAVSAYHVPSIPLQTQIIQSISNGQFDDLNGALIAAKQESSGRSINFCFQPPGYDYPYQEATKQCHPQILYLLQSYHASSRCHFDYRYRYPVTAVIRLGRFDELLDLLEKGQSLLTPDGRYSVLSELVRSDSLRIDYIVDTIMKVSAGFDKEATFINTPDFFSLTPLGHLFDYPRPFHQVYLILKALLSSGADMTVTQVNDTPFELMLRIYANEKWYLTHLLELVVQANKNR